MTELSTANCPSIQFVIATRVLLFIVSPVRGMIAFASAIRTESAKSFCCQTISTPDDNRDEGRIFRCVDIR